MFLDDADGSLDSMPELWVQLVAALAQGHPACFENEGRRDSQSKHVRHYNKPMRPTKSEDHGDQHHTR